MLEIGMRVRVSGYSSRADDYDGMVGVIKELKEDYVVVTMWDNLNICFKPSQLKKIKIPKEFWIGKVRYENPKTLWEVTVAHREKPKNELDSDGNPWIYVKEIKVKSKISSL